MTAANENRDWHDNPDSNDNPDSYDKEWAQMPQQPKQDPDPAGALHALAHEAAPPSAMNVLRAARDGFRLRRRRQVVRTLTGVTTAGALAAAAVLVPAQLGRTGGTAHHGSAASPTATATATPTASCPAAVGAAAAPVGADFTVKVAARFGWLPANLGNEIYEAPGNYSITQGGMTVYPKTYTAALRSTANADLGIFLSVVPPTSDNPLCTDFGLSTPGAGILPTTGTTTGTLSKISGPKIDGHWSTWTLTQGVYTLSWQTSDGDTISLSEGSPESSAQPDLLHIADTLQVGAIPLPLPIQIKNVPASAQMEVGQFAQNNPQAGTTGATYHLQIALTFGAGTAPDVQGISVGADQAGISVAPAGHGTGIPSGEVGACKTSDGLDICVTAPNNSLVGDHFMPSFTALLDDVVSLGTNQADWSPNLVTGTKQP